jgi:hypothetical protein
MALELGVSGSAPVGQIFDRLGGNERGATDTLVASAPDFGTSASSVD